MYLGFLPCGVAEVAGAVFPGAADVVALAEGAAIVGAALAGADGVSGAAVACAEAATIALEGTASTRAVTAGGDALDGAGSCPKRVNTVKPIAIAAAAEPRIAIAIVGRREATGALCGGSASTSVTEVSSAVGVAGAAAGRGVDVAASRDAASMASMSAVAVGKR